MFKDNQISYETLDLEFHPTRKVNFWIKAIVVFLILLFVFVPIYDIIQIDDVWYSNAYTGVSCYLNNY